MPVPLLRDARPAGWVNCFSTCARVQCREPKTGQQRFNSQRRQNTLSIWVYNLSMIATFGLRRGGYGYFDIEMWIREV